MATTNEVTLKPVTVKPKTKLASKPPTRAPNIPKIKVPRKPPPPLSAGSIRWATTPVMKPKTIQDSKFMAVRF